MDSDSDLWLRLESALGFGFDEGHLAVLVEVVSVTVPTEIQRQA